MLFQSIEMGFPEPAIWREPVVELGQGLRSNAVQAPLAVGAGLDQTGLFEDPKVFRDRRLAEAELLHELTDRSLPIPEQIDDGLPAWLT